MKPTYVHFHFVTLFPETIEVWLTTSILGRAHKEGLFTFKTYQLREFAQGKHHNVDDAPYGGGGGMVLRIEPLVESIESIQKTVGKEHTAVIFPTPTGKIFDQTMLEKMRDSLASKHLIFVCGHYEGVDQRFLDNFVDWEISLGSFVLTGGELPAVAITDALVRTLDGALGNPDGPRKESFTLRDPLSKVPLLEYPHYTRPANFRGMKVPEILSSGNHQKIEAWRVRQSRERTENQNNSTR